MEQRVLVQCMPPAQEVSLREPVFADLVVENGLAEKIHIQLGERGWEHIVFRVTSPDGTTTLAAWMSLDEPRGDELIARHSCDLEPGQDHIRRLLLNEWCAFSEQGVYSFEAKLTDPAQTASGAAIEPVTIGRISVHIGAYDPERLTRRCESLLQTMLKDRDGKDAGEAALALAHIYDPIAIPFAVEACRRTWWGAWYLLVPGLGRFARMGSTEAAEALSQLIASPPELGCKSAANFHLLMAREQVGDPTIEQWLKEERARW